MTTPLSTRLGAETPTERAVNFALSSFAGSALSLTGGFATGAVELSLFGGRAVRAAGKARTQNVWMRHQLTSALEVHTGPSSGAAPEIWVVARTTLRLCL